MSIFVYLSLITTLLITKNAVQEVMYLEYSPFPDIPDAVCKPKDQIFWQKYDHFNATDSYKWEQRYWNVSDYHKNHGPVFLWLNGATPLSKEWTYNGQLIKYAKKHNAYCFFLEHRFYGKSLPESLLIMPYLEKLNSQQALADAAYFIESMKKQNPSLEKVKWIVFGGSYGGSLASWLRMKYPSLVHGAVASGAALLATTDFNEYYNFLMDSFSSYQRKCTEEIIKAYEHLNHMIKSEKGRAKIKEMFNLCTDVEDTWMGKKFLFYVLAENIAAILEHSKDYGRSNERSRLNEYSGSSDFTVSAKLKYLTMKDVCYVMTHKKCFWEEKIKSTINRYAEVHTLILQKSHKPCLAANYSTFLNHMREGNGYLAPNARRWWYQRCNEFGYFQTSDKKGNVFSDHLDEEFYFNLCSDIFGESFYNLRIEKGVLATNRFYGARNTAYDDNILLVFGSLDPWQCLGIYKDVKYSSDKVIIIKGAGHCSDLYLESFFDKTELKNARKAVSRIIELWLKREYN